MKFLLINSNPAVSRLIGLSIEKLGYDIDEFNSDDLDLDKTYDVTIVDSESASNDSINLLREDNKLGLIMYIGSRGSEKPDFADLFLQKPFLPTDFVDMVKKIDTTKAQSKENIEEVDNILDDEIEEEIDNSISLDLDEINSDSLDMSLPNSEDSDEQEDLDEKLDEELDEELVEEEINNVEVDEAGQEDNTIIQSDDLDKKEPNEDEISSEISSEINLEEDTIEDANISILDSEDIDEVKQLLENDEDMELIDDEKVDLEEEAKDVNLSELETDENSDENDADIAPDDFDLKLPEEIKPEAEEESSEEASGEDSSLDSLDDNIEEIETIDEISKVEVREKIEKEDIHSIDDLSEDDFNEVFEMQENLQSSDVSTEIDNIKDELTQTISKEVKNVLDKDEIKDALKGLKVNISISFDEA